MYGLGMGMGDGAEYQRFLLSLRGGGGGGEGAGGDDHFAGFLGCGYDDAEDSGEAGAACCAVLCCAV